MSWMSVRKTDHLGGCREKHLFPSAGFWVCILFVATMIDAFAQPSDRTLFFSKRCLMMDMNEGCAVADIDKDGKTDVIAGDHWYRAPEFIPYPLRQITNAWHDTMASNGDHPYDVDGDGWVDILSNGWKDKTISWYQNPGSDGVFVRGRRMDYQPAKRVLKTGGYDIEAIALSFWPRHELGIVPYNAEAIELHDFDRDGTPEIYVACLGGKNLLYRIVKDSQGRAAIQAAANDFGGGHGYGFGDINGDGRDDIVNQSGWWEQPDRNIFEKPWKLHPECALPVMAACPFVITKLTDSGRSDILWGKAHDYGIYWREQGVPKPDGTTTWTEHLIDDTWSQVHAMVWTDIDGDGQPELVAGKRARTHVVANTGDPGCKESGCLYYYDWDKAARKFTRHTICDPADDIGLGMQIAVADLNGDGRPDVVVSGKTGTWILFNEGFKQKEGNK